MRGTGRLVALALGATLPAGAPAFARAQAFEDTTVPARVAGSVTAVWRANPATCAAHGLCAFSGSVISAVNGTADVDLFGGPGRAFPEAVALGADNPATVRVRREGPGEPATCVDSVDAEPFLEMVPAANGRVAIPLGQDGLGPLLSSGRCAGPLPSDLPRSIVSRPIDSRRVGRRPVTVDFSGRTPLPAGPFAGEVVSTLRVTVGHAHPRRAGGRSRRAQPSRPHPRGPRMQVVLLEYGVEGASGSLTVDFSGLPGPGCAPLDGCTTAGSIGYSVGRTAASFLVFGRRRVRDGGGGLGFALLALRQGRMHAQVEAVSDATDGSQPGGTTSARVTLPDGTACTDSVSPPAPAFEAARSRGGALRVTLGPVDEPGIDAIRTRCPGPAQVDVSGGGALAAGAFDPHALGHPAIDLPLRTGGAFSAPGYAGSRSGEVVLHLRLRRARAVVVRLPASREGVPGL